MDHRLCRILSAVAPPQTQDPSGAKLLGLLVLIAFFGGAIRSLHERKPDLSFAAFAVGLVTQGLTSALAGLVVGSLGLHWMGMESLYLVVALVAVSGWMGVVVLEQLGGVMLHRLKRRIQQEATTQTPDQSTIDRWG